MMKRSLQVQIAHKKNLEVPQYNNINGSSTDQSLMVKSLLHIPWLC